MLALANATLEIDTPPRREVELRCAAWVRAQAPLRRVLSQIAGRLVAMRGWERLGFARLSDYARERTGLSARQVYDLAHVDEALGRLPQVDAALLSGVLCWSKGRLLCRVAASRDEAAWIEFARDVSVRRLEREVRALDRGSREAGALSSERGEDGVLRWPQMTVQVRCAPYVHGKWFRARQLAQRVAGARLPPWACMEAVVAEVLSGLPLRDVQSSALEDGSEPKTALRGTSDEPLSRVPRKDQSANVCTNAGGGAQDVVTRAPCALASELPPFLRTLIDRLLEADAFELDARLRRAVALEQRAWSEVGALLSIVASERLFLDAGYPSLESYARDRLGISPRKARALLRLERAGAACPELLACYRDGQLSWTQAQALVPILLLDHAVPWRAGWIEHALHVSIRRLEEDVERAIAFEELAPPDPRQTCAKPTRGESSHEPAPRAAENARFVFTAPLDVANLIRATICTVRRHLERRTGQLPSEGEAVDAMFDHAFESWGANEPRVPREHRVFERDGWRCTAPGCSSYRNLQDHHIIFRSKGGSDALSNRTTLCAWHHLRGVHANRIRCKGEAPHGLEFEFGLRTEGPPLLRYLGGDVRADPQSPTEVSGVRFFHQ